MSEAEMVRVLRALLTDYDTAILALARATGDARQLRNTLKTTAQEIATFLETLEKNHE